MITIPCAAGPRAAAPRKPAFGFLGRNAAKRAQKLQTMLASISHYNHTRIIGKAKEAMVFKALGEFQKALGIQ